MDPGRKAGDCGGEGRRFASEREELFPGEKHRRGEKQGLGREGNRENFALGLEWGKEEGIWSMAARYVDIESGSWRRKELLRSFAVH